MVPERWYAVANALHKLLRSMISVITGEDAANILDWLKRGDNPIVKRSGDITIAGDDGYPVWLASWFILHCHVDGDGLRLMALS